MILLYTGATIPDAAQINSEKSLGGFVSSSPIPNARLGNLFSGISKSVIIGQKKEIRMVALKNTTGAALTGVTIHTENQNNSFLYKIAAVASAVNNCGEMVFEQVQDGESLPYQATLSDHEGLLELQVGNMAIGQVIGIWICREPDITKYPEFITQVGQTAPLTTAQLIAVMQAQSAATEEFMQLLIKWD